MTNKHNSDCGHTVLYNQLIRECRAMAHHAFASGLNVPGEAIETLERFIENKPEPAPAPGGEPAENKSDIKQLVAVHSQLSKIVEPAIPRTILLLHDESCRKGFLRFLGPVPFIRRMMLAAIVSLVLFIGISLSSYINEGAKWDLFKEDGLRLLIQELFLLCAAGLGASFTALFKANRYIMSGSFDPKYESSYWIRFVLGIMAGMLLATLIPIEKAVESGFGKPLLAMLGGFAADVVYKIITRIIETVGSLVRGDMQSMVDMQKKEIEIRLADENVRSRTQLVSQLIDLQQQIDTGMKPAELKDKMKQLVDKVVQGGT